MKKTSEWLLELNVLLKKVETMLKKEKWFKSGWTTRVGYYPNAKNPEWATMQLFKKNWFNGEDLQGMHFEVGFGPSNSQAKEIKIAMHIHAEVIPGTSVKRKVFMTDLMKEMRPIISKWRGIHIKKGFGGMESFSVKKKTNKLDLVNDLTTEFRQFESLGNLIDQKLSEIIKKM